jgi:hypothetical protein
MDRALRMAEAMLFYGCVGIFFTSSIAAAAAIEDVSDI